MVAISSDVVGEQLRAERLLEAICLDRCFQFIELFTGLVVGPVMFPLGFECDCFVDVWEAAELQTQLCSGETFAAVAVVFLRCVDRPAFSIKANCRATAAYQWRQA
jgi:hypothetical protein